MKRFVVLILTVCLVGACTTLHPIAGSPAELSERVVDGGVLHSGDRVVITTVQGTKHNFLFRSAHDGAIYGDHDSVPLNEIATLQKREFSTSKTVILVIVALGVVAAVAVAAANAAPAAILSSTH